MPIHHSLGFDWKVFSNSYLLLLLRLIFFFSLIRKDKNLKVKVRAIEWVQYKFDIHFSKYSLCVQTTFFLFTLTARCLFYKIGIFVADIPNKAQNVHNILPKQNHTEVHIQNSKKPTALYFLKIHLDLQPVEQAGPGSSSSSHFSNG